ncbi:hypothetical protein ACWD6R_11575 [Streptomyces sp. NPDC005151]
MNREAEKKQKDIEEQREAAAKSLKDIKSGIQDLRGRLNALATTVA